MLLLWLYGLWIGLSIESGHQEWLTALQRVHHLRWMLMSHPTTAVARACQGLAVESPRWVRCHTSMQWKTHEAWGSVCIDYANGSASFSPRYYWIQLRCSWMSVSLPSVDVWVFR